MNIVPKQLTVILLTSILVGCSSGGGGRDDDSTVTPKLPDDATTFTTTNTSEAADEAVSGISLSGKLTDLSPKGGNLIWTGEILKLVREKSFDRSYRSNSIASRSKTESCPQGGSVKLEYEEKSSSVEGSLKFNDCGLSGLVINDGIIFRSTFNDTTGAYSDSVNGRLKISNGSDNVIIALDYKETGNDFSGEFSVEMSMSITGSPDVNFLLTTTSPIIGVGSSISGGEILVEGADDTRVKITVTGVNVADVFLDDGGGTFVFHSTVNL